MESAFLAHTSQQSKYFTSYQTETITDETTKLLVVGLDNY